MRTEVSTEARLHVGTQDAWRTLIAVASRILRGAGLATTRRKPCSPSCLKVKPFSLVSLLMRREDIGTAMLRKHYMQGCQALLDFCSLHSETV